MNKMVESMGEIEPQSHEDTKVLEPVLRFAEFAEFSDVWNEKILGDCIDSLDAGVSVNSTDRYALDQEKGILKTSCVTNGVFDLSENKAVIDEVELVRLKEPVSKNSIIISRMNTPALVGANAFVDTDISNLYLPDRLWAAKVNESSYPKWIGFLVSSSKVRTAFSARATGTSGSMKNITKPDVLTVPVIVPEKEEQQKIADFLSSVDKKIEHLTEKHRLLTEYKKGVMQQIFTQQIRFKDDQGNDYPEWSKKTLGEICSITTGKLDANAMSESGRYRFYTCAKEFYQIDAFAFDTEALLISGNGANVGYIHYYKGKFNAYQRTYVLDAFECNIIYVKYFLDAFLKQRIFNEKKEGNTPYIVLSALSEMIVQLPVEYEQEKIAKFLTEIDQKIDQVWSTLEQTKAFKKGLLQKMFV